MSDLIDHLPGVAMPIEDVERTLAHMWDAADMAAQNPMGFRASQMNMLLHMGMKTSPAEARELFDQLIAFSQRYPCRILLLCPTEGGSDTSVFRAKVYSQCFLGEQLSDVRCCEALILSFQPEQSAYLESQMSLWLESDLPVYNWFHRVPVKRLQEHYGSLMKRSRRILFDSAVDGAAYAGFRWPDAERVFDLAAARTLPLRQHLGQFFSNYSPQVLVEGLERIEFMATEQWQPETSHLLNWNQRAIARGCELSGREDVPEVLQVPMQEMSTCADSGADACALASKWHYRGGEKCLQWQFLPQRKLGTIQFRTGSHGIEHNFHIEPLGATMTLAEALFFG